MLDDAYFSDLALRLRHGYLTDYRASLNGQSESGNVGNVLAGHIAALDAELKTILNDSAEAAKGGSGVGSSDGSGSNPQPEHVGIQGATSDPAKSIAPTSTSGQTKGPDIPGVPTSAR